MNWGYDELTCDVIVPTVYFAIFGGRPADAMWWDGLMDWPTSIDSRDEAWADILECADPHKGVSKRLVNAWQTEKRSREYLNGEMDSFDLDNLYYGHAYKDA